MCGRHDKSGTGLSFGQPFLYFLFASFCHFDVLVELRCVKAPLFVFIHSELAFPLLDLLRCLVRWPRASEAIFQPATWARILDVSGLEGVGADSSNVTLTESGLSAAQLNCVLFVFRLMVNAIAVDASRMKASTTASVAVPPSLLFVFEEIRRLVKLIHSPALSVFDKKKNHLVSLVVVTIGKFNLLVCSSVVTSL